MVKNNTPELVNLPETVRQPKFFSKYSGSIFVGDGGFACIKLGHVCLKSGVSLVSRLRLDASLFEDILVNTEKRRGRKPVKGLKIPSLKQQIKDGALQWEDARVAWYGSILKSVKLATGVNLWYKPGEKPLQIRWVLVQDLTTKIS